MLTLTSHWSTHFLWELEPRSGPPARTWPPHSDPPSCNGLLIMAGTLATAPPILPRALTHHRLPSALSSLLGIIGTFYLLGWGLVAAWLARWAPHTALARSAAGMNSPVTGSQCLSTQHWMTGSLLSSHSALYSLPFYLDSHGRNTKHLLIFSVSEWFSKWWSS